MLKRLSFAGPEGRGWGAALLSGTTGVLLAAPDGPAGLGAAQPVGVEVRSEAGSAHRLLGDGVDLQAAPFGDGVELSLDGVRAGFARCRLTGSVGEISYADDAPATGTYLEHDGWDTSRADSVRDVAAWFAEGVDYGLLSIRPRKGKGHDHDLVLCALLARPGEPPPRPVEDGRLSSTYTADGQVRQAGLELWLEEATPVEAEGATPPEETFPHRVAGERLAGPAVLELDGLALALTPFVWHSRGREGLGVYGLGRQR